jgi:GTP cyclohydrolase I
LDAPEKLFLPDTQAPAACVPERAYDNPKFVEDPVRDFALRLQRDPRIGRLSVASQFESIHDHCAYAEIEGVGAALID